MMAKKLSPAAPRASEAEILRAEEAALGRALRAHRKAQRSRPTLDDGPSGFARGPVETAEVLEVEWDVRRREYRPKERAVIRRCGARSLAALPQHCRDAAEIYAETVELVGSVRGPGGDGPKGGISDGGAVMRCAAAERLRRCREAIGDALILDPRGVRAHRDRARRALRTPELVDAVALEGRSIAEVLARAGWSRRAGTAGPAKEALEAALERVAEALGIIVKKPG